MGFSTTDTVIMLLLLGSILLGIIVIAISLLSLFRKYRSRPYALAFLFFLAQICGILIIMVDSMTSSMINNPFEYILKPDHILSGFFPLFATLAYITELKAPGYLNRKRFLASLSPIVVLSGILLLLPGKVLPLKTPSDILGNIWQYDVLIRLALTAVYVISPFLIICIRYNGRLCLVSRTKILGMETAFCFLGPAFIFGFLIGYLPAFVVNFIILTLIDVNVAYIELKVRIPITETASNVDIQQPADEKETVFDNPEIWMDPDISIAKLTSMMGTNRTYLQEKIKASGFTGFTDMINRKRVGYICRGLDSMDGGSITNLMFESGFRSRSTASSEFKRIMGCTPSEYVKSRAGKQIKVE